MDNFLKTIIGETAYEKQKKIFKDLQDNITGKAKEVFDKKVEDLYILQKNVVSDLVEEGIKQGKELAKVETTKLLDKLIEASGKVKFIGFILKAILKSNREKILTALFK